MNHSPPFVPKLIERVHGLLHLVQYSRVEDAAEKELIYRLRYNCYLREDAIIPRSDALLTDEFDNRSNTQIFALRIDGVLVASIRLHILRASDDAESPTMKAFGDVLLPYIEGGLTLIDPTRFVVNPEEGRRFPELMYLTLRLPFLAADHFAAAIALAAVRKEHMAFYQRVLRYSKISEPREYLQLVKPLGLMVAKFPDERENVLKRYPFFAPLPNEIQRIFAAKLD